MKIKVYAESMDSNELRYIDTCITDSVGRALQMYEGECEDWERLVYTAVDEDQERAQAAAALGGSTSERKAQAARENGKRGGRPRKNQK